MRSDEEKEEEKQKSDPACLAPDLKEEVAGVRRRDPCGEIGRERIAQSVLSDSRAEEGVIAEEHERSFDIRLCRRRTVRSRKQEGKTPRARRGGEKEDPVGQKDEQSEEDTRGAPHRFQYGVSGKGKQKSKVRAALPRKTECRAL